MDERLDELRRQLDQKTTEIESLVAAEQGMGNIESMDPSDYERLQQDVEELLERWEEDAEEGQGNIDDAQLHRLIAERFEIEQKVIAARKDQSEGNELEDEGAAVEEVELDAQED
jgi:hypothetical protein